jgi:ribosomal protein S18 acetylase RimI-like enzyme
MDFTLRKARQEDFETLYAINRDAYLPYVAQIWGWDEEFQHRFFREHVVFEKVDLVLVGGRPVGFISVDYRTDMIFLESMAILSEYRSKGIGTAILLGLMNKAKEMKVPLHLQVFKVNDRARALYERLRFERWGESETHWKYRIGQ